ncbi:hypothetical protein KDL29_14745 [bacterium]|nr:hypothetical protein [bacterium]
MRNQTNNLLLVIPALLGLLLFSAGCNQGEDPAEAMLRDYKPKSAPSTPAGGDAAADTGLARGAAGDNAALLKGADGGNPCGANPCGENPCGEPVDDYTGPKVEITIESVDNGIPEYEGAAKYEVRLEVQSDEEVPTPSIWEIKAFDEAGEVVGETKKHLTIPSSYPKIIALSGFYCTSQPISFQVRRTEGEGLSVEESQGGGGGDSKGGKKGGSPPSRGVAGGSGDDEDDGMGDE